MRTATGVRYRTVFAMLLAIVVFLLSGIPLYPVTRYAQRLSLDLAERFNEQGYPRFCIVVAMMLGHAVSFLPSFGFGLYVFRRYSSKARRAGYTRCSECSYILNGLGGLRCPECGKEV